MWSPSNSATHVRPDSSSRDHSTSLRSTAGGHMDELHDNSELTPKQEESILALLSEPSISKAATKIGVDERTVRRWLDESAFNAEYRKARREAFGQAIGLTQRYAGMAVNTILKIMT